MYDLTWAERVVQAFRNDHINAAQEIEHMYSIQMPMLIHLVATNDERWRGYKALVKFHETTKEAHREHWAKYHQKKENGLTFVKYLRRVYKRRGFPKQLDLLDDEVQTIAF